MSCQTNLISFFEKVSENNDQCKAVDVVYLDFAKAFDTVPHIRQIFKLRELGLGNDICTWVPQGLCTAVCRPGTRRALRKGSHTCCYDCIPCSEGEISNVSDSENCQKCADDEWSNEYKDECIPRILVFLSYKTDMIAIGFSSISVIFFILSVFIIGIFVSFRDTPLVKANNRNLSFILLISLKLSLLCVHLFIGHPVDITCMLRQISFGILFTVALSSVLAKTVMVCIAFKATKPGSSWRKWLGAKLPYSVVFICSCVQVLTSAIWLSVSPPNQQYDRDSSPGMIIIQCKEGSVLAFCFMLGYMGFLAALSFLLAFMVRTLPDIYNEAKFITFSMLLFCTVWICAIPAYLSSKGKHVVIVEVFAILASAIGILSCIFFPKCYNILLRPEINIKSLENTGLCKVTLTSLLTSSQNPLPLNSLTSNNLLVSPSGPPHPLMFLWHPIFTLVDQHLNNGIPNIPDIFQTTVEKIKLKGGLIHFKFMLPSYNAAISLSKQLNFKNRISTLRLFATFEDSEALTVSTMKLSLHQLKDEESELLVMLQTCQHSIDDRGVQWSSRD
ncbi:vomeronasal type-2 receptor 26-like [Pseudophryne corroboree]|uniref:vomeronasal type-2 receptor 26-like n=1 Tax=Pseudophryne corroboree TaxID=495146 RepID=UPI0030821B30